MTIDQQNGLPSSGYPRPWLQLTLFVYLGSMSLTLEHPAFGQPVSPSPHTHPACFSSPALPASSNITIFFYTSVKCPFTDLLNTFVIWHALKCIQISFYSNVVQMRLSVSLASRLPCWA